MKKILGFTIALLTLTACNSGSKDDKKDEGKTADVNKNPDYQKGLELVAKDKTCFTCHGIDQAITGPSYRDVANKYANAGDTIVPYLANKIIKGGTGTWGEIFMTPHRDLSMDDAEAMVKYILLLKK